MGWLTGTPASEVTIAKDTSTPEQIDAYNRRAYGINLNARPVSPFGRTGEGARYAEQGFRDWQRAQPGVKGDLFDERSAGYGANVNAAPMVNDLARLASGNYARSQAAAMTPIVGLDGTANAAGRENQMASYNTYAALARGELPSAAAAQYMGASSQLANQAGRQAAAGGARGMQAAIQGLSGGLGQANMQAAAARGQEINAGQQAMGQTANGMRAGDLAWVQAGASNAMTQEDIALANARNYYAMANGQINQAASTGLAATTGNADRFVNRQAGQATNAMAQQQINYAGTMNTIGAGLGGASGFLQGVRGGGR